MAWFRRKNRAPVMAPDLDLGRLEKVFRPFYLNEPKVSDYFTQAFGDLRTFATGESAEVTAALGGEVGGTSLLAVLAGLNLKANTSLERTRGTSATREYAVGSLAKFNVLHRFWTANGSITDPGLAQPSRKWQPQQLIGTGSRYRFIEDIDSEADLQLTVAQLAELQKQFKFERKHKGAAHFVVMFNFGDPCVSILSSAHITSVGYRYLRFMADERQGSYYCGAVIGEKAGMVFLDPIALGERAV